MARRVMLIVMDGCGVGTMPDAAAYGATDSASATLPHIAEYVGGLSLPCLESLGLGRVAPILGVSSTIPARGSYGSCAEESRGKDSLTGHWEMMGIVTDVPFPTYPNGFPSDVIAPFEKAIGRSVIGNIAASGTEIIARLGGENIRTGSPIVYTSADSVFQIAAHEEIVPLAELYAMCETARAQLVAPDNVQRVIARPFVGDSEAGYRRTQNRRDFPLAPPPDNVLAALNSAGKRVHAIGVIADLFPRSYFATAQRTQSNTEHLVAIEAAMASSDFDFLFANCEDFDMLYGHRNDPPGFAKALVDFDAELSNIVARLRPGDLLMLTADHGNDPTTASTDHSREYVPLLVMGSGVPANTNLGIRSTFADIGATVASYLDATWSGYGKAISLW